MNGEAGGNGGGPSPTDIADTMVEQLDRLADLLEVVAELDPAARRRTCMSVGDNDAGLLVLAALTGRFSSVADVSMEPLHSLWLRPDLHRRILPDTKIIWQDGDVFEDRCRDALLRFNGGRRFDFCYLHKMLHHLRNNDCQHAGRRDHACGGDECVGHFVPATVFRRLFEYADTLIVSEHYYLGADDDKEQTARGGMLAAEELQVALAWLKAHARLSIHRPTKGPFDRATARRLTSCEYVLFSAARRWPRRR